TIYIARDKTREHEAYSQYNDINGNFLIQNLDYPDLSASQYVNVVFTLASERIPGDVYVTGAFNYWQKDNLNRMIYNEQTGEYTCNVLLKQGWYDYQYVVDSPSLPPLHLEGSHFETENQYEILVYYRPFQPRADLLIGYLRLEENKR